MNAYMKLYVNLRDAITRGVYDYGTKIPSKRRIADQKGTSIITVEHALSLLTEEGYIEPRERSGCYVTYREDSSYAAPRPHERKAAPPSRQSSGTKGNGISFPSPPLPGRCAPSFPTTAEKSSTRRRAAAAKN